MVSMSSVLFFYDAVFIHFVRFRWQSFGSWGRGLHFHEETRILHAEQSQFLTDPLQDSAESPAKLGPPLGKPIFHLVFSPVLQRKWESIQHQTKVEPTVECKQQLGGITELWSLPPLQEVLLYFKVVIISLLKPIYRDTECSIFSKWWEFPKKRKIPVTVNPWRQVYKLWPLSRTLLLRF